MPDTKTTAIIGLLGVVVSGAGVFVALREYIRKDETDRPALDITSAVVVRRLQPHVQDYRIDFNSETDALKLTIKNQGTVEAANIVVWTATMDDLDDQYRTAWKPFFIPHQKNMPPTSLHYSSALESEGDSCWKRG
jgi:hypothetical protein